MSDLSDQLDDIQQQVDDHDQRLDTSDDTIAQHDDSINDHEDRIGTNESTIQDVSDRAGQLDFPLTQDSIDRIKEVFPTGTFNLTGTTITITDPRVSTTSIIMLTRASVGTTGNNIYVSVGNGSFTVTSSPSTDNGDFMYVIF